MFNIRKIRLFAVYCLIFSFGMAVFSTSIVEGRLDPFKDIQEKLNGITEQEKENLKNLYILTQEISAMEKEEESLAREIDEINGGIKALESGIAKEEASYEKRKGDLKQVLRSYQRMGPGTYIEIILDSDSLTTFLRRVNILRDLTRNTGELLSRLEDSRDKLSAQKSKLTEELAFVKVKQGQLKDALDKKQQLKTEKEKFLVSLAGKREYYQGYLADIQKMWDELKPLFSNATKEFAEIVEKGNLPPDALKISFSFKGITGSIGEKVFNEIIKENSSLTDMVFDFTPGKVEITVPDKNLSISGKFVLTDGQTIKFEAEEGSFYGLPLENATMKELFQEGELVLNLKPLLGDIKINSMEVKDGSIELYVTSK